MEFRSRLVILFGKKLNTGYFLAIHLTILVKQAKHKNLLISLTNIHVFYIVCGQKRGHILNLKSSGAARMAGLTIPETESNHTGWFEFKNSQLKASHGR